MRPVLSTRVFGAALPRRWQLELARKEFFLDLELWSNPLLFQAKLEEGAFVELLGEVGLSVPCVHLPTDSPAGPLDISSASATVRRESESAWRRCLDLATTLGSKVLVAHVRAVSSTELERFAEEASTRNLSLALETQVGPMTQIGELMPLLAKLSSLGATHGLCIDMSRDALRPEELRALGGLLKWVEFAASDGLRRHLPPDEGELDLLPAFMEASSQLPYVAFEVVSTDLFGETLGEAALSSIFRRIHGWMRDYGRTRHKEGIIPDLPMG